MMSAIVKLSSCAALLGSAFLLGGCADASEKNNEDLAKSRDQQSQAMGGPKAADVQSKYEAAKAAGAKTGP